MQRALFLIGQRLIWISRKTLYIAFLTCLLLPLLFLTSFCVRKGLTESIFVALLCGTMASISGWCLLRLWEKKMQRTVEQLVKTKMKKIQELPSEKAIEQENEILRLTDEVHQLHLVMEKKMEEMRGAYLEFEDLRKEYQNLEEESTQQQKEFQEAIKQKEALLCEYQKTMGEQRTLLEKRQRYIFNLEGKVRELVQEIKHLLHVEAPTGNRPRARLDVSEEALLDSFLSAKPSLTSYDLSIQLHSYVEKIENLTGVDHLGHKQGKGPRFLDLSLECYAVDRRRLYDVFKEEKTGIFFLYSLQEKKFVFASLLTKDLLGIGPEKFIKEFGNLVVQGYAEWEEALLQVRKVKEISTKLAILNKDHQLKLFECIMGKISKGPFAGHVLGVLASTY